MKCKACDAVFEFPAYKQKKSEDEETIIYIPICPNCEMELWEE